jgi:hypothetical protein
MITPQTTNPTMTDENSPGSRPECLEYEAPGTFDHDLKNDLAEHARQKASNCSKKFESYFTGWYVWLPS